MTFVKSSLHTLFGAILIMGYVRISESYDCPWGSWTDGTRTDDCEVGECETLYVPPEETPIGNEVAEKVGYYVATLALSLSTAGTPYALAIPGTLASFTLGVLGDIYGDNNDNDVLDDLKDEIYTKVGRMIGISELKDDIEGFHDLVIQAEGFLEDYKDTNSTTAIQDADSNCASYYDHFTNDSNNAKAVQAKLANMLEFCMICTTAVQANVAQAIINVEQSATDQNQNDLDLAELHKEEIFELCANEKLVPDSGARYINILSKMVEEAIEERIAYVPDTCTESKDNSKNEDCRWASELPYSYTAVDGYDMETVIADWQDRAECKVCRSFSIGGWNYWGTSQSCGNLMNECSKCIEDYKSQLRHDLEVFYFKNVLFPSYGYKAAYTGIAYDGLKIDFTSSNREQPVCEIKAYSVDGTLIPLFDSEGKYTEQVTHRENGVVDSIKFTFSHYEDLNDFDSSHDALDGDMSTCVDMKGKIWNARSVKGNQAIAAIEVFGPGDEISWQVKSIEYSGFPEREGTYETGQGLKIVFRYKMQGVGHGYWLYEDFSDHTYKWGGEDMAEWAQFRPTGTNGGSAVAIAGDGYLSVNRNNVKAVLNQKNHFVEPVMGNYHGSVYAIRGENSGKYLSFDGTALVGSSDRFTGDNENVQLVPLAMIPNGDGVEICGTDDFPKLCCVNEYFC